MPTFGWSFHTSSGKHPILMDDAQNGVDIRLSKFMCVAVLIVARDDAF